MVKMLHFVIFACLYNVIINIDLLLFGSSTLHVKRQFASFFSNKNTFGILLVIGIIVCTYLYMLNKKSKFFFVFLFFILNLIWTESTNSLISVIIFLATFFFMFYKINYIKRTLIIFAGVSISFFLLRSNFFEGVVNFMRFGDISELSGRTNLWLAGLKVFSENIIFGIGLGHSPRILSNSGYENDQFHNGYIEILVSGGIVLFIIYFLLASIFIYKLRILRLKNNLMGSIYLAGFLSLLFSTFFESLLLFRGGYFSGIITLFYIFMPLTLINSIKRL
ncbi:O-antigen ligase family protein [uncultured Psychrobacillus sp.]|uniref:O-antigen ligase family protein n=1 Tax=uncultured Psychrobacillus sp. TaxID=1551585 RepID=UPI002636FC00|nr:O-antigen ligase family protein [uncultured Psychrobacillus sp.]